MRRGPVPAVLGFSWLFYLLTIALSLLTLGALAGVASRNLGIFADNVQAIAIAMLLSFFLALLLTAWAGWRAFSNPGGNLEPKPEERMSSAKGLEDQAP